MEIVKVGIGVFVFNEAGHVLLGKRINSHGHGTWGLPGGHLEHGETPIECAIREVREETGLILTHTQEGLFTNDIFEEENKHYVTLFIYGTCKNEEPQIQEPEKCLEWQWFEWGNFPTPLLKTIPSFLEKYKMDDIQPYISGNKKTCHSHSL